MSGLGTIVEFSRRGDAYFCLVSFEGIRLVCSLRTDAAPRAGQEVRFLRHRRVRDTDVFEVGAP